MPKPTVADVHVNQPLTNISIAYFQGEENFVADRVFPNIPVQRQSDRYYTYSRADFNRDEARKRAPGTESAGGSYTLDNTPTFFCDVYGFHKDIPDQVRANEDSVLDSDRDATVYVTQKMLIKREVTWSSTYFTGGVWTGGDDDGVAGTPSTNEFKQWNDAASTPIEDIRAAKTAVLKATGFEPNTFVIGQEVFDALIDHPDIVDRVKYGQTSGGPADVDVPELRALFKIPRVMVMKAVRNTADEGATESSAFIGGKKALLCYSAPQPGLLTPSAGYTFSWRGYMGMAGPQGQVISKFRMQELKSDRIEGETAFDQKLVASELGYFFDTAVA